MVDNGIEKVPIYLRSNNFIIGAEKTIREMIEAIRNLVTAGRSAILVYDTKAMTFTKMLTTAEAV